MDASLIACVCVRVAWVFCEPRRAGRKVAFVALYVFASMARAHRQQLEGLTNSTHRCHRCGRRARTRWLRFIAERSNHSASTLGSLRVWSLRDPMWSRIHITMLRHCRGMALEATLAQGARLSFSFFPGASPLPLLLSPSVLPSGARSAQYERITSRHERNAAFFRVHGRQGRVVGSSPPRPRRAGDCATLCIASVGSQFGAGRRGGSSLFASRLRTTSRMRQTCPRKATIGRASRATSRRYRRAPRRPWPPPWVRRMRFSWSLRGLGASDRARVVCDGASGPSWASRRHPCGGRVLVAASWRPRGPGPTSVSAQGGCVAIPPEASNPELRNR